MPFTRALSAVTTRLLAACAVGAVMAACGGAAGPASQPAPAASSSPAAPASQVPKPAAAPALASAPASGAASTSAAASSAASGGAPASAKPAGSAAASGAAAQPKLEAVKLGEGVYGIQAINADMNTGFVVGDDGVMTWACNPGTFEARMAAVKTVTDKPIKWHANGHFAGDDTGCNPDFKKMGATLFGSEKMREDYLAGFDESMRQSLATPAGRQVYLNRSTSTPPDVTYADEMVLHLGKGRDVHMMYMGKGHTIGDAIAWMPDQKVIFSADLTFNQNHPTSNRGDTVNWQKILSRMIGMNPTAIVTGHGSITQTAGDSKQVLQTLSDYFTNLRAQVKGLMDKGRTLEQIKAEVDWTPYKAYGRVEQMPENIAEIYRELGGK